MNQKIGLLGSMMIVLLTACGPVSLSNTKTPETATMQTILPVETSAPLVTIIPDTPIITPIHPIKETLVPNVDAQPQEILPPTANPALMTQPQGDAAASQRLPALWFATQPGTPLALPNITYPDCSALSIGGQVFDQDGKPLKDIVVYLSGTYQGQDVVLATITGRAAYLGEAGYEFVLSGSLAESQGQLFLRLLSSNWDVASERIPVNTYADCTRSFVMVNFTQFLSGTLRTYLPLVPRASTSQPLSAP
jgi:hypothetical protein